MSRPFVAPIRVLWVILFSVLLAACGSTSTDDTADGSGSGTDTTFEQDTTATVNVGNDGGSLGGGTMSGDDDASSNLPRVFYFDFDQATLNLEIRSLLDGHAAALRAGSRAVRLEGHADERGTREYNLALGERRAKAVANYLVLQGVDRARIETVSYGEERPADLGQNARSFQMNRRVELK